MPKFIYNKGKNLRFDLETRDENLHAVRTQNGEYFIVINCQDKCVGEWNRTAMYCGTVSDIWDEETITQGIIEIMHTGGSPYQLQKWLTTKVKKDS